MGKKGKFFAYLSQIFESKDLRDFILTPEADENLKDPAQARAEIKRRGGTLKNNEPGLFLLEFAKEEWLQDLVQ